MTFWAHSFDFYATADILAMGFSAASASNAAVSYSIGAYGRNGTQGLQLARTLASGSGASVTVVRSNADAVTPIEGFAFYTNILPPSGESRLIASMRDANTAQVDLYLLDTGALRVKSNTTVLGTTTYTVSAAIYYYIEWQTTINTSTGSTKLWITFPPGNTSPQILDVGAVNTQVTGNAYTNQFAFVHNSSSVNDVSVSWYDDYYHSDGADAVYPTRIGNVYVLAHRPNGTGSHANLTPTGAAVGYQAVNEALTNGDVDYISGTGTSTFPVTRVPIQADIKALVLTNIARTTGDPTTVTSDIVINGGDHAGSSQSTTNTYVALSDAFEHSPATGLQWLTTEVNVTEFGGTVS